MLKIAVFDDNQTRRESLEALFLLRPEWKLVGSFPDCRQAVAQVEKADPDLILMDISMPEVNGIEAVGHIKSKFPQIKIIMQTVFEEDDKIFASLRAGADGYVLKNSSPERLLQSIDDVMQGGAYLTPSVAMRVMRHFDVSSSQAINNLSGREHEVLEKLAAGKSYKMIADDLSISYFTVNSHVKKIYEKLQVHSVTEALRVAKEKRIIL